MAKKETTPTSAVVDPKTDIGSSVITRVNQLCATGFTMPADYNYVNAIKMSMLKLNDVKDKNGNAALAVCTPNSVATALFQMATKGLNAALNQCYLIVRGDQLTLNESYFGKILQVKRIFPDWNPSPRVIREGDVFEFEIIPATGHRRLVKHQQTLESMDKDFVGGYVILPTVDGEGDLYIMTKKQILAAWAKSSSKEHLTHKQFDEKMVTKTVVNSGCNTIINATPSLGASDGPMDDPNAPEDIDDQTPEVIDIEAKAEPIDLETGEVKQPSAEETAAPAAAPAAPAANDGDDW